MGRSQKKRLLAASERFRRNYFYYFGASWTTLSGVTKIPFHIEKRILNRIKVWK